MGGVRQAVLSTICAWCDRVRSGSGEWREADRSDLALSPATHGICPDCLERATEQAGDRATMTPATR